MFVGVARYVTSIPVIRVNPAAAGNPPLRSAPLTLVHFLT
jgi:hypothetical protein